MRDKIGGNGRTGEQWKLICFNRFLRTGRNDPDEVAAALHRAGEPCHCDGRANRPNK